MQRSTDRFHQDPLLRAEALVRGWGLLLGLAVVAAVPLLRVQSEDDPERSLTGLSMLLHLVATGTGDYGSGHPGIEVVVVALRVTAVVYVVAVLTVLGIGIRWLESATLVGPAPWVRVLAGRLLVACAVALFVLAAVVGDPTGEEPNRYEGLAAAPGLVLLPALAALLLARPSTAHWPGR